MGASKSQIVLAVWFAGMLAGTIRASDRRLLQACVDSLGLNNCTCINFGDPPVPASDLANGCPHDGQRYVVCLSGNAKGGCRLEAQGHLFPSRLHL
ncbi:g5908 [Coccomyxa elongata]